MFDGRSFENDSRKHSQLKKKIKTEKPLCAHFLITRNDIKTAFRGTEDVNASFEHKSEIERKAEVTGRHDVTFLK